MMHDEDDGGCAEYWRELHDELMASLGGPFDTDCGEEAYGGASSMPEDEFERRLEAFISSALSDEEESDTEDNGGEE